jgi:hypothetical protein
MSYIYFGILFPVEETLVDFVDCGVGDFVYETCDFQTMAD